MPVTYTYTHARYSGMWTKQEQLQAIAARTWTGLPFLYAWGNNAFGQCGQGNTTYYSSPKQVGALTTWLAVAGGGYHTLATKTDGTLWSWGYNTQGQ